MTVLRPTINDRFKVQLISLEMLPSAGENHESEMSTERYTPCLVLKPKLNWNLSTLQTCNFDYSGRQFWAVGLSNQNTRCKMKVEKGRINATRQEYCKDRKLERHHYHQLEDDLDNVLLLINVTW